MTGGETRSPRSTATGASYGRGRPTPAAVGIGWALVLSAVLLWPLARSGYPLGGDMVFTPHQPLGLDALGVGTASPRAVPLDAIVAGLGRVLGGWLTARVAVVGAVLLAGVGAVRLVRPSRHAGALAAASAAVYNPYVVERLALGQWALLWAYAMLPWIVLGVQHALPRDGPVDRRRVLAPALPVALASVTPTGGLIALVVATTLAVVLAASRGGPSARARWTAVAWIGGLALVVQAPWVVAGVVSGASGTTDPAGVAAFAARDEYGGVVVSLLSGGGIWNANVVPSSRATLLTVGAGLLVLVALAAGARPLVARLGRPTVLALAVLAALGGLLAALPSTGAGADLERWALSAVPGAGLLRDAQKWVAPLVALTAWTAGAAADRLATALGTRTPGSWWRVPAAVTVGVVPLLLLPGGARTVTAVMRPVHYPSDWAAVGSVLHRDRGHGAVAVLPAGSYRRFAWAGDRTVLDPAPRLLDARVVVDDTLTVSGTTVAGEDPTARAVQAALRRGDPGALADLGVGWVLVERGQPASTPPLADLDRVYAGTDLILYRVEQEPAATVFDDAAVVVIAHLAWVLVVAVGVVAHVRRRRVPARSPGPC